MAGSEVRIPVPGVVGKVEGHQVGAHGLDEGVGLLVAASGYQRVSRVQTEAQIRVAELSGDALEVLGPSLPP